jgi:hypothetical protein
VAIAALISLGTPPFSVAKQLRSYLDLPVGHSQYGIRQPTEVVDHELGLEPDRVVVTLDIAAQLFLRSFDVEFRIGFAGGAEK